MKKMFALMFALMMILSLAACKGEEGSTPHKEHEDEMGKNSSSVDEDKDKDKDKGSPFMSKGKKYTYLHDEWNLYIATALSKNTIKVERWYRFDSGEDTFKHEADVCVLKTNDDSINFKWLDEGHTAFSVKMRDTENSHWEDESVVGFSIEDSDNEVLGANFSDEGKNYTYLHDKWNLYKAIALSDSIIKIEQWGRFDASEDGDPFKYEADICLIDTSSNDSDFEWVDDDYTSFTITMQDLNNSYWEEASTVIFSIE